MVGGGWFLWIHFYKKNINEDFQMTDQKLNKTTCFHLFSIDIFRKRPAPPQEKCSSRVLKCLQWSGDILPATCLLPAHWPWPPSRSRACPGLSSGLDVGRKLCCSWCHCDAKKGFVNISAHCTSKEKKVHLTPAHRSWVSPPLYPSARTAVTWSAPEMLTGW